MNAGDGAEPEKGPPLAVRSWLFLGCAAASALPALQLYVSFYQPGAGFGVLLAFWAGVLLGPLVAPVLSGVALGPVLLVAALACPPMMLAHPVRPGQTSAALTLAGFALWYATAFVFIGNWEAPV